MKLTNFGHAKLHSKLNSFQGKPELQAPETTPDSQISDLFAAGFLLVQMILGRKMFENK